MFSLAAEHGEAEIQRRRSTKKNWVNDDLFFSLSLSLYFTRAKSQRRARTKQP